MISSEAYIAGSLLIDGGPVIQIIRGIVKAEDFQLEAYQAIYSAALSLADNGDPIDPVSIRCQAQKEGIDLSNNFFAELMECTPLPPTALSMLCEWPRMPEQGPLRI